MSERESRQPQQHQRQGQGGPSAGRKLAEWVTLGLSLVLVLGAAAYLVYESFQDNSPLVPVEVRLLSDQAQERAGKYVVPVEVRNRGRRTLKGFKVQVAYQGAGGRRETGDVLIDYLGEGATERVYLYFDRPPGELRVQVSPMAYQLD